MLCLKKKKISSFLSHTIGKQETKAVIYNAYLEATCLLFKGNNDKFYKAPGELCFLVSFLDKSYCQ